MYIEALFYYLKQYFPEKYQGIEDIVSGKFAADFEEEKSSYFDLASQWASKGEGIGGDDQQGFFPLYSIFEYLNIEKKKNYSTKNYQLPIEALTLTKSVIFPNIEQHGNFSTLWKSFIGELRTLVSVTFTEEAFTESFIFLLKKYFHALAVSDAESMKFVSLFEHLKISAAMANSLQQYESDANKLQEKIGGGEKPLLLFCADISGIQTFIYNIASSKAAKSLKGRSFYLQLLMDSIIQKIIAALKKGNCTINIGHIVYSSGGKMYMLLPNLDKVKEVLKDIEKEILEKIFEEHKTRLYVCMESIAFSYQQNTDELQLQFEEGEATTTLGNMWVKLGEKAAKKKHQKFQRQLLNEFGGFFTPINEGYDTSGTDRETCAITGDVITNPKPKKHDLNNGKVGTTPTWVNANVKQQIETGKKLKTSDFYITFYSKQSKKRRKILKKYALEPVKMGAYHYLKDTKKLYKEFVKQKELKSAHLAHIRKINDTDFLAEKTINGRKSAYGFTFYGGNKQALREDENGNLIEKDYAELAGYAPQDSGEEDPIKGFKRLGVLRMDVDGLGGIFAEGLKPEYYSFGALATLSAQLDVFFSGYLSKVRDSKEYCDWVNILYSGGDDLFVVGRWDKVIDFAEQVRSDFREYVCNREEISISGGVTLVGGKFPIAKAANMAGEVEHKAKEFRKDKNAEEADKNAFCLFGEVVDWGEFVKVNKIKDAFVNFHNDGKISSGFIQQFRTFKAVKDKHKIFKAVEGTENSEKYSKKDLSYKWNTAWLLGRYKERSKKYRKENDSFFKFMTNMQRDLFIYDRQYDLYAVAARWAELKIRQDKK